MYSRVYVEITNACNMRCSFCHGHTRQPRQMHREEFARVLEQLAGKTGYLYYHLMGEPLTHPLLPEFIKMATRQGFRSVLTTNGTLLHRQGAALLAAGVHKVSISLHSFEQADEGAFLAYLRQMADFARTAVDAGTIVTFRLWNSGFDEGRNRLAEQFLRSCFSEPWVKNTRGYRLRDRLFLEWGDRFAWPDLAAPLQGPGVVCHGLQDHFGILADGSVVPCCLDSNGVITLGNIFTQDIDRILASSRANAMRAGFQCRTAAEELCRRCGYARRFLRTGKNR